MTLACWAWILVPAGAGAGGSGVPADAAAPAPNEEREDDSADSDRPRGELAVVCDAPCAVFVDGQEKDELAAAAETAFEVDAGKRKLRALSVDYPAAVWEKEVEVEEDESATIEVPMLRTVERRQAKERREMVWRDIDLGFMWTRSDGGQDLRWKEAIRYCEQLQLGGYANWRLPTLAELEERQSLWSLSTYKIVGSFTLTACCQWSTDEVDGQQAWNYNFRFRRAFPGHKDYSLDLRAICLRPLELDELEEARQTILAKKKGEDLEKEKKKKERKKKAAERKEGDGGDGGS